MNVKDTFPPNPHDTLVEVTITLSNIWKEVLSLKDIDHSASFLALGGDSLSAMLCIARIRATMHTEFLIEELLSNEATVDNLAILIHETNELFRSNRVVS